MTSTTTFKFTRRPEMSGEYTFHFTPFNGAIIFSHEWNLTCYNVWGKYTGSGVEGNIHLPYNTQLKVKNMWGKQNFGRLYIEIKNVTPDSITVRYRIKCYHPGEWYSGLTYNGKLTCITESGSETEVIRTYSTDIFIDANLETEFPLESWVWVQASDGISYGGTRNCTITNQSGEEITISLKESPDAPGYYRGAFFISSQKTMQILVRLHLDEFESALLKCDVNGDDVYSYSTIWAEKRRMGPENEETTTYSDGNYTQIAAIFAAEATCFVLAKGPYSGNTGGTRELRVVADSGDEIRVTLKEETFFNFKGFFLVTDGPTDDSLNRIHLEEGEGASLYVDINGDGVSPYCRIARFLTAGEEIITYENPEYTNKQDTFDYEATVYVDGTALAATDGTRTLIVQADSGDQIKVVLEQYKGLTHFHGSFKVTAASTNDELDQIHLDSGERAILSCDVDRDGDAASCEIWCITKEAIDETYATHYQIQVNTQQDMLGTMMWDSQKCPFETPVAPGERCPDIEYAGSELDLSGNTTYWWRIKFWTNYGTEETPWSTEEAYFCGAKVILPKDYEEVKILGGLDIRKPRGKAEVEIDKEWIDLREVTSVQISNNKNPLDNIETAQGTVYLSNIDQEFYPDKTTSEFFDQLFGRRIRMSLGFLDYPDTQKNKFIYKMMGIVKSVNTDRAAQTAEIVALEFMDFYRTKQIEKTPVYEDLSLTELYCELVRHCFPSWLNQHEPGDWNYWIHPLGFRRTNIYIGTGKSAGSETIPIRDCSRTPCTLIYNIVADSEAVYDDKGFRLFRGEDYEMIREETDQGTISWIHFLKLPYPTNEDAFYVSFTVDVHVGTVQYKDTTLIEELEKIALVADCRLYADEYGRLVCKSNELKTEITEEISHETNLMNLSTRKDIDSIINHVVVESKPYQTGVRIDLGTWEVVFKKRQEGEAGKEFTFSSEEFVENFRFDLTWSLKCSSLAFDYWGSGSETNFELPLRRPDGREGIQLYIVGANVDSWGELRIEAKSFDAYHTAVFLYLICEHSKAFYDEIVFDASLSCHAEKIGQPETYRGEAIDEVTYQDRYVGRKKRTFTLEYLEPGDTQARQAAVALLASLRRIRVYYDCTIRGLPHLRLMDTLTLTEPKAELEAKRLQAIKLVENMRVANYIGEVGLMERKIPSAVPYYWGTEDHDFIITKAAHLSQTYKFIFDSEITSYKFSHSYSVDAFWISGPLYSRDCKGDGVDENFDLPYSVNIEVYWKDKTGEKQWMSFGTLTIDLIEATATSVEVSYKLALAEDGGFPYIDYLGTLSCHPQFASQSPGSDGGDAPPDQPHYPDDEPHTPPEDTEDDGWEYKTEFSWNGSKLVWAFGGNIDRILAAGLNTVMIYFEWFNQSFADEALKKGLWAIPSIKDFFPGNLSGAVDFVNKWKTHPAIGAWWFMDEPELHGYSKAQQESWYNALKSADPSHEFLTIFSTDAQRVAEHFNPNAFDHCGVDCYPFNPDCFNGWNGDWERYLRFCLEAYNDATNAIGGMAVAQTFIWEGAPSPAESIGAMLKVFQSLGIGTRHDGYGFYEWDGINKDAGIFASVQATNAGYDWPHVSPKAW